MSNRITMGLLFAIIVVFILQAAIPGFTEAFVFAPLLAFSEPWRFITSMFLHGSLEHILLNALGLFMFGMVLENSVSEKEYLIIFFVGGLVGSLAFYLTCLLGILPMSTTALGASGAIFGIMGAVAVLQPNLKIFFMGFIPLPMKYAAVLFFIMETIGSANMAATGIANAAHLGGLVFGILYAYYLRNLKNIIRPKYDWEY